MEKTNMQKLIPTAVVSEIENIQSKELITTNIENSNTEKQCKGKNCCSKKTSDSNQSDLNEKTNKNEDVALKDMDTSTKKKCSKKASCCSTNDLELKSSCCDSKGDENNSFRKKSKSSCCSTKGSSSKSSCCPSKSNENAASTQKSNGSCCSNTKISPSKSSCCKTKSDASTPDIPTSNSLYSTSASVTGSFNSLQYLNMDVLSSKVQAFKNERGLRMAQTRPAPNAKLKSSENLQGNVSHRLCIGGMTCSGCCSRIERFLIKQPGILNINVSLLTSRATFTYDPSRISTDMIEKYIQNLGFSTTTLPRDSIVVIAYQIGQNNVQNAIDIISSLPGVENARQGAHDSPILHKFEQRNNSIIVEYDPDVIGARVLTNQFEEKVGYKVFATVPQSQSTQNESAEVAHFAYLLLWSVILSIPVIIVTYVLPIVAMSSYAHLATWQLIPGFSYKDAIGFAFATPMLLIIAKPIHKQALSAIRYNSRATMDVLISLSTTLAYAYSVVTITLEILYGSQFAHSDTFFEVTSLLITLILFGRYMEKIAKAHASNSVDALLRIQAKTAILLELDCKTRKIKNEHEIDIVLVERNDFLKVLPGSRIPTDGIVIEGNSTVDESMITGESRKVEKEIGSRVIGGTINDQGVLIMQATHIVNESMLSQIVNLVDEAQSTKCVSQSVADVVSSYFTTAIIVIATVMFIVWYELAAHDEINTFGWTPFPFALRFAITILVISCPCAIALAVPTAIMVATTIGAKFGILFKGGQPLEDLAKVDVVIFDKTGTLTAGELLVTEIVLCDGPVQSNITESTTSPQFDLATVTQLLASAESNSEHPIGIAIANYAKSCNVEFLQVKNFLSVPGCGVTCDIGSFSVAVGSLRWMQKTQRLSIPPSIDMINSSVQSEGKVVVVLAVDNEVRALIKLTDSPRKEATHVVEQLQKLNIQTWMVTGDQKITSVHLAESIGIPDCTVIAGVLPHQKADTVRLLQSIGKNVAFVGDGVNDGPALAIANVGIAIGAGTEVALESADIVLVKNDLTDILNAIDLSRVTCRMIKWNFTWGFMYNIVMMPIACGVLYPITRISIPPALAGLSELFSSVPVILYSLLLMYWKPPYVQMNNLNNLENKNVSFTAVDILNEETPMLSGKHDYGTSSKLRP